jgi:hypothetical protein
MASELNELQNATVGMTVGVIEVRSKGCIINPLACRIGLVSLSLHFPSIIIIIVR